MRWQTGERLKILQTRFLLKTERTRKAILEIKLYQSKSWKDIETQKKMILTVALAHCTMPQKKS